MFYFPPCTLTCHYVHLFSCSSALIFYQPITLHVGMVKQYREQYKSMDLIGLLLVV